MTKIGIVGKRGYSRPSRVSKLLFSLRNTLGEKNVTIVTGGINSKHDIVEDTAKKMALELAMKYSEYNPSYTGYKLYSAMPEYYYGKNYHISQLADRYKKMVENCDMIYFFGSSISSNSDRNFLINYCKRYKKEYILVK